MDKKLKLDKEKNKTPPLSFMQKKLKAKRKKTSSKKTG